jgi:putative hydrolase of the HAD superfamily
MGSPRKYLIWDFDGTLAYRPGQWSAALVQAAKRFTGQDLDLETLRPYLRRGFPWHNPERANPPMMAADLWWDALLPVFEEAFTGCQLSPDQAKLLAGKVRAVYLDVAEWRLFDDTIEVLTELRGAGWTHAILSNHVPELRSLIDGLGLGSLIHRLINSAETGFEKPHRRAYQAALDSLDDAGDIWMIGDNVHADVVGAEAAGLRAILVRGEDPRASRCAAGLRDVRGFLD